MHPFHLYLISLRNTRSSLIRTTETSFYPDLKLFLDTIGKELTPIDWKTGDRFRNQHASKFRNQHASKPLAS